MKEWIDFYDTADAIYVSPKHRAVHFQVVADDIIAHIPTPAAVVVDYSCGEALDAARVAAACGRLILAEPAPGVRQRLAARYEGNGRIEVRSLDDLSQLPDRSVDLIIMNSVAQYLSTADLAKTLGRLRNLLKPDGRLVLGDIIRPESGMVADVGTLLRFATRHGFLTDALVGLVRTALSGYGQLRGKLGLSRYHDTEMIALLKGAGFAAQRAAVNIGHNPTRMTFIATPA